MEVRMKPAVHIVTDSACDLPQEVVTELGISVVPLVVRFGSEVYEDGAISLDSFWERAAGSDHPQTSQPPVGAFEAVFERAVGAGQSVVCVTVTSKHSGTINSASLAAQRFAGHVHLFDSLSLSLGLGVQVRAAAEAAQVGHSVEKILALLADLRARVQLLIVLDTMENLRRGGRADGFIQILDRMARAFDIKPIIDLVDGQLQLMSAARSFHKGVRRMQESVEALGPLEYLAVVHTRRQALAEEVAGRLAERIRFPRGRIWVAETGPALASHAGPGVIGVMAVPAG
jgi:DegV family protein with EDD domain